LLNEKVVHTDQAEKQQGLLRKR